MRAFTHPNPSLTDREATWFSGAQEDGGKGQILSESGLRISSLHSLYPHNSEKQAQISPFHRWGRWFLEVVTCIQWQKGDKNLGLSDCIAYSPPSSQTNDINSGRQLSPLTTEPSTNENGYHTWQEVP